LNFMNVANASAVKLYSKNVVGKNRLKVMKTTLGEAG